MNKSTLEDYLSQGLSNYEIAKTSNKGKTTISYWLKKHGLKNLSQSSRGKGNYTHVVEPDGSFSKVCPKCKAKKVMDKSNFSIYHSGKVHGWCRLCSNQAISDRQRKLKLQFIEYKGGKCICCGYDKCAGSLDFHHLDPSEKDYNISDFKNCSLRRLKLELDKCVLLCKNCHGEFHSGFIPIEKLRGS